MYKNNTYSKKLLLMVFIMALFIHSLTSFSQNSANLIFIDFENKFSKNNVSLNDAKANLQIESQNHALKVTLGHNDNRPSVKFTFPVTDLSNYIGVAMDIKNLGSSSIAIEAYCFNENIKEVSINDGVPFFNRSMIVLEPGETDSLFIALSRPISSLPEYIKNNLTGMFGLPGGFLRRKENPDITRISNVSVFKQQLDCDYTFTIDNIRAVGKYKLPAETELKSNFFPFVDVFGQYMHSSWPNKTRSIDDIKVQKMEEDRDLAANPGKSDLDIYGGWKVGPSLKATGHFRVEKYQNKWWLVDPEGKLFWSQGINIVGTSQRTPTKGRENYFTNIPQNTDFFRSNLLIKYGNIWSSSPRDSASNYTHKRLRSWGINTLAANSDPYLYTQKKTPYTIEIRSGISNPLPDTLDEASFRKVLLERLKRKDIVNSANDPWCIGYFVDNECAWPSTNAKDVIDKYFKVIQEELKKLAPQKLYLGCRSNSPNFNRIAFEAEAKYCDVISINHYDYNISDFKWTEGLDKPVIIGEFHFGALDRGLFHTGLRSVSNQKQRARVYTHFINQCLKSPIFVGAHWFQYVDQVCTGRGDGENYQIGFVDICDRPYPELISATRKVGSYLYTARLNNTKISDY